MAVSDSIILIIMKYTLVNYCIWYD